MERMRGGRQCSIEAARGSNLAVQKTATSALGAALSAQSGMYLHSLLRR
jgi:hypothetical protein